MTAPAGYFDRVNPDLLALIPPDAKTVLEIGCGTGALCEAYRRMNPGVDWFGIEHDKRAAHIAGGKITSCYHGDVETIRRGPDLDWHEMDCLVLGDILEHLREPGKVLSHFIPCLRPGAQILACIPNTQHWTVIRDLIEGRWEYADEGLLDRTHLRFFTRSTVEAMFRDAGLHIFEIRGRDIANEGYEAWIAESGVKPRKEMRAYQYIVRAYKPGIEARTDSLLDGPAMPRYIEYPKLHIHAITAEACCARPRILEPFAMMGTVPGVRIRYNHVISDDTDIVILQRPRPPICDLEILAAHQDKIIVVELDDDPSVIGCSPDWLRGCHAVQVSTEPLANIVRQYNPHVAVFPNQIAELPIEVPERLSDLMPDLDAVDIFYGAQNRETDWAPIMPTLNRVLKERGGKTVVHVLHDRAFFDALETACKVFEPFCEYARYRQALRSCDIALLPLEPTRFNECKSDLKFLECAAEGVLAIAGPVIYEHLCNIDQVTCSPKDDRLKNGVYVFGYNSAPSFERALRGAIDHAGYRKEVSENAYYYVGRYRLLSQHYRTRLEWYRNLLESKAALDRDLLERVPQLARPAPQETPALLP